MAITPIKALLFLAGGATAAGATAYVSGALDPYLASPPAAIASLPEPPAEADPKGNRLPGQEPPAEAATPGAEPPAAAEAPATEKPAEAAAEAPAADKPAEEAAAAEPAGPAVVPPTFDVVRVESDGSIVIAGKAAPNAKVEIVIGSKVIGETVAGADGDFAVVLDKPLKPGGYQIVLRSTAPGNVVAMSVETAVVSIPETEDGQVLALVEEPGKPAEMISVPEPEAKPESEAPLAGQAAAEPPAGEQAAAEPPAGEVTEAPPAGEQAAAEPSAPAEPKPGEQVEAAVTPQPAPAEAPAAPAVAGPKVAVEAVEIEGRKIFVAGAADAGRMVRGYANDILLGDATASPEGRFLIEAERDLPVGDYIVRIDALDKDGATVVARAAVPFEREPGEAIAAVAPPAPADETPAMAEAPAAPGTDAGAEPPAVATAPAAETPPAIAEAPGGETLPAPAAPGTDTAAAEPPAAGADQPGTGDATAEAPAAAAPPAATEAQPPVAAAPAPAPAPEVAIAAASPAEVPEVTAPKLQSVDSAVIIRRGDTLWRISRRVYGRGVRYSTIYLANQTQIEDPDRIWPGQVFKVPEKSSEGEAADMTGMGEQVTTMPQETGAAAQ